MAHDVIIPQPHCSGQRQSICDVKSKRCAKKIQKYKKYGKCSAKTIQARHLIPLDRCEKSVQLFLRIESHRRPSRSFIDSVNNGTDMRPEDLPVGQFRIIEHSSPLEGGGWGG